MKVLLLSKVEGLGAAGDVVEVTEEHAKNALFPSGLAATATDAPETYDHKPKRGEPGPRESRMRGTSGWEPGPRESRMRGTSGWEPVTPEEDLAAAQALAEELDQQTVTLSVPLNAQGALERPVTGEDILNELARASKRRLPEGARALLAEPLHEPGEHPVTIELPHNLEVIVHVIVEGLRRESADA